MKRAELAINLHILLNRGGADGGSDAFFIAGAFSAHFSVGSCWRIVFSPG